MLPHIRQAPGPASAMEHHPVLEEEVTVLWEVRGRLALVAHMVSLPEALTTLAGRRADLSILERTTSAEDLADLIAMDSTNLVGANADSVTTDSMILKEVVADLTTMDSTILVEDNADSIMTDSTAPGEVPVDLSAADFTIPAEMAACTNPGDKPITISGPTAEI